MPRSFLWRQGKYLQRCAQVADLLVKTKTHCEWRKRWFVKCYRYFFLTKQLALIISTQGWTDVTARLLFLKSENLWGSLREVVDIKRLPWEWMLWVDCCLRQPTRLRSVLYAKDQKEGSGNYRLISLTSVPMKVMEQILLGAMTCQMKHMTGETSTGSPRKLLLTKLTTFYDKVTHSVGIGQLVDITYSIFSKAFDTVFQKLLLEKLVYLSLDKWSVGWVGTWLTGSTLRWHQTTPVQTGSLPYVGSPRD